MSLLLDALGQSKSQGPSRFKGKLRLRLSWEELPSHVGRGCVQGGVGIWARDAGSRFCRSPEEGLSDAIGWSGKVSCGRWDSPISTHQCVL